MSFSFASAPYPAGSVSPVARFFVHERPETLCNRLLFSRIHRNVITIWQIQSAVSDSLQHLLNIFLLRSLSQVLLAHAGAIAASVQHLKRVIKMAVIDQVSDAMRQVRVISHAKLPVARVPHSTAAPLIAISLRALIRRTVNKLFKTGNVLRGERGNVTIGISHWFFSFTEKFVVRAARCFRICPARFAL